LNYSLFNQSPLNGRGYNLRLISGAAVLQGGAVVSATATRNTFGDAAFTAEGVVSGRQLKTRYGDAALSGVGTVVSTGKKTRYCSSALTGLGTAQGAGVRYAGTRVLVVGAATVGLDEVWATRSTRGAVVGGSSVVNLSLVRWAYVRAQVTGFSTVTSGAVHLYSAGRGTVVGRASVYAFTLNAQSISGSFFVRAVLSGIVQGELGYANFAGISSVAGGAERVKFSSAVGVCGSVVVNDDALVLNYAEAVVPVTAVVLPEFRVNNQQMTQRALFGTAAMTAIAGAQIFRTIGSVGTGSMQGEGNRVLPAVGAPIITSATFEIDANRLTKTTGAMPAAGGTIMAARASNELHPFAAPVGTANVVAQVVLTMAAHGAVNGAGTVLVPRVDRTAGARSLLPASGSLLPEDMGVLRGGFVAGSGAAGFVAEAVRESRGVAEITSVGAVHAVWVRIFERTAQLTGSGVLRPVSTGRLKGFCAATGAAIAVFPPTITHVWSGEAALLGTAAGYGLCVVGKLREGVSDAPGVSEMLSTPTHWIARWSGAEFYASAEIDRAMGTRVRFGGVNVDGVTSIVARAIANPTIDAPSTRTCRVGANPRQVRLAQLPRLMRA